MASGVGTSRRAKRKWLARALFAIVLIGAGGAAAWRYWPREPDKDPERIGLLQAAALEFKAKRYDQATTLLDRRAADVKPTSLDWLLRAQIAEAQGRLDDALRDLKQIPDSNQYGPDAWLKTGQVQLARNHAVDAEAAYRHSLQLDPEQIQPHRELAYLYALQLRRAECDAEFRALADRVRPSHILAFAWCQNYARIWDPNENGKALRRFVAADPADRWSRLALATSYQLNYKPADAEETLRPLGDTDPEALALRVRLAIDRGDAATAEKLAQAGPADHPRLNALRGQLALYRNDARQATAYFRAAVRADPSDRDAIQGLGTTLRRIGDPEAAKYLQMASRQDKLRRTIQDSVTSLQSDTKLFYKLGEVCESLDRLEEAKIWYQLAIARVPLDADAQQALLRVEEALVNKKTEANLRGDARK